VGRPFRRPAPVWLLDGQRLRPDVLARRVSDGNDERLVASESVRNGDTIRFEDRE
jgi:hypothetical protein